MVHSIRLCSYGSSVFQEGQVTALKGLAIVTQQKQNCGTGRHTVVDRRADHTRRVARQSHPPRKDTRETKTSLHPCTDLGPL